MSIQASGATKEIVAEGRYQGGDDDTPTKGDAAALLLAKRDALEQAGTFVTSKTSMKNLVIEADAVNSLAAGTMEVTVLDKKRIMVNNRTEYYVKIKAVVNTDQLENFLKTGIIPQLPASPDKKAMLEKYQKINLNLTYNQVVAIMGEFGDELCDTGFFKTYAWGPYNVDNGYGIIVDFAYDHVSSKSKEGL